VSTGTRRVHCRSRRLGAKFLLSPKIDAQLSQRTEGKIRDKAEKSIPKEDKRVTRSGAKLTNKTSKPKATTAREPEEEEEEDISQTAEGERPTSPSLPDMDLNPKKAPRLTATVNQGRPKEEPAYKNRAPVEVGLDVETLVDSVLEMEVTIPLKSLAGVSGAIQKEIRKQMTKARIPVEEKLLNQETVVAVAKTYLHDIKIENAVIDEDLSEDLFAGSVVAGDPVLQFVQLHEISSLGTQKVGKMTEPLRSIYTKVNGLGQEECLMDGGSMIVSMSKKVAVQLGLVWDPTIRIDMESASNHVDRTLGVARNVPFEVGGLKLFLQVHILEDPPYRILLGKPFETLGATTIQTYEDGSAEVVIKDPNTKRIAVVPTYKRGEAPEEIKNQKYQNF
jgi:hypothetical protein